jgi:hypothetical protein
MLKIERKADSRVIKAILHRLADIPGGVTVSVADLGGTALVEGTPIYVGANGLYNVMKTAKVVTEYVNGTSLEISKGSHFKVGDKIANEAGTMYANITAIDKSNAVKDVVTLTAQFASGMAVDTKLVLATVATNINHTAVAYAQAENNTPTVLVKKGHTLAVGDYIKGATMTGKIIADINRYSSELYDTVTLGANTGAVVAADEALTAVTAGNGTTVKTYTVITKQAGPAVAIVGSNHDVVASDNLFVDAWLIAVVKEANGPVITDAIKAQLSGVKFI